MSRNGFLLLAVIWISLSVAHGNVQAQTDDPPRYEVGAQFTSITKPDYNGGATEPGFGGRFTFNLNKSVALEAVGNFFPHKCSFCGNLGDNAGNISQAMFGVKAGKRFQKWGIFAKGRPGLVSFSQGDSKYETTAPGNFQFIHHRLTNFAVDLGGVLEFYPSKHIVTRFDAGDTLIKYRRRDTSFFGLDASGGVILIPYTIPGETRHNFQFSAGVGFRF